MLNEGARPSRNSSAPPMELNCWREFLPSSIATGERKG